MTVKDLLKVFNPECELNLWDEEDKLLCYYSTTSYIDRKYYGCKVIQITPDNNSLNVVIKLPVVQTHDL